MAQVGAEVSNVVDFRPENYIDNPDAILKKATGELKTVLLIGYDADGNFYARSSICDGGELLWLVETFRHKLLSGEFQE